MTSDLSDCHGAEDVEEYEGAVSVVIAHEVAMGDTPNQREGFKGEPGYHTAIKPGLGGRGCMEGVEQSRGMQNKGVQCIYNLGRQGRSF